MESYKNFRVGQWVKSYSKGYYRIEKFIPVEYEEYDWFVTRGWGEGSVKEKLIGTEKEPFVILKRLFATKFKKKQLGTDYCSAYYLKELDKEEFQTINNLLKENPLYLTDLDKYKPAKFETRYGLSMLLTNETSILLRDLALYVRDGGKTFTEIFAWLRDLNYIDFLYKEKSPNDRSAHYLQFVNWNYETKDKKLLFSDLIGFTPELVKLDL